MVRTRSKGGISGGEIPKRKGKAPAKPKISKKRVSEPVQDMRKSPTPEDLEGMDTLSKAAESIAHEEESIPETVPESDPVSTQGPQNVSMADLDLNQETTERDEEVQEPDDVQTKGKHPTEPAENVERSEGSQELSDEVENYEEKDDEVETESDDEPVPNVQKDNVKEADAENRSKEKESNRMEADEMESESDDEPVPVAPKTSQLKRKVYMRRKTPKATHPEPSKEADGLKKPTAKRKKSDNIPGTSKVPSQPSTSKKRKGHAAISPFDAHSKYFYYAESQKFFEKDLAKKEFLVEGMFKHPVYGDVGFLEYLDEKLLSKWGGGLNSYCPRLVKEFYANLQSGILDPTDPWYRTLYMRNVVHELTPELINTVLGLPENESDLPHTSAVTKKFKHVAKVLTSGKAIGSGKLSPKLLTLKYWCLFRFCGKNVLPTSNSSHVTSDMGTLLYAIDKNIPFNFGLVLLTKMRDFAAGDTQGNYRLPYPGLITLLLEELGIKPKSKDIVHKIKMHKPSANIHIPHNDLRGGDPLGGEALVNHLKEFITRHMQKLQTVCNELAEERKACASMLTLLPRTFEESSEDEDDCPTDSFEEGSSESN